jgi:hypothetical protein
MQLALWEFCADDVATVSGTTHTTSSPIDYTRATASPVRLSPSTSPTAATAQKTGFRSRKTSSYAAPTSDVVLAASHVRVRCPHPQTESHVSHPFNLNFFDSAQCLMVRRWRLIGHFPILYNPQTEPFQSRKTAQCVVLAEM